MGYGTATYGSGGYGTTSIMVQDIFTDVGEEWYTENNVDGATISVGVYNDATDGITDTDNLSAITTEPTNANYARQSSTITTKQISGDFGFDNDSQLQFDFSDQSSSETVDTFFVVVNFQSDTVAGDGATADNLVATVAMTQNRDIGAIDTLNVAAGDLEVTIN